MKFQVLPDLPGFMFVVLLLAGLIDEPRDPTEFEWKAGQIVRPGTHGLAVLPFRISLFSTAALFSRMGALFSRAARGNLDSMPDDGDATSLSLRIVGSIIGFLMVLLFLGGFVAGTLFPTFGDSGVSSSQLAFSRPSQWAKLLVRCFVAGFSERLLPSIPETLASKIEKEKDVQGFAGQPAAGSAQITL